MIDSVYKKDENYYPKALLEKYNLLTIEERMSIFNDKVEAYSNGSDEEYTDDFDEENFDRKIRIKKFSCINLFKKKKQGKYDKLTSKQKKRKI